ncbi:MAG TPA: response regulator [Polyangiaceae bacterium]|nr:response regulator [Polyangiaceae bacterium]
MKILVLEDDPRIARCLQRELTRAGYQVCATRLCRTARAWNHKVDVAVLDIELPDGSGVDIARELLAHGTARRVIFFSSARDQQLLRSAAEHGEVLTKSGDFAPLITALASKSDVRLRRRRLGPARR